MKIRVKVQLLLIILISHNSLGQLYQEMRINEKGNIVYRGVEFKKLKNLKTVIEEKNDIQLNQIYRKTLRNSRTTMIFGRIRDFGLTYAVFNEPFTFNIQPIPLAIGLGGLSANIGFRKKTKRNLEELVEISNLLHTKEEFGFSIQRK